MKCDELKETMLMNQVSGERTPSGTYKKAEVDAYIAELKARIHELENMPHTDNSAVIELLENENKNLKDKVRHYPMMAAIIEALKKDLDELREATRWRKVDKEFPTADEGYFDVLWEDGLPDIGYIGADDDIIETIRDRGEGHSVEWWKPSTKAPEVDK